MLLLQGEEASQRELQFDAVGRRFRGPAEIGQGLSGVGQPGVGRSQGLADAGVVRAEPHGPLEAADRAGVVAPGHELRRLVQLALDALGQLVEDGVLQRADRRLQILQPQQRLFRQRGEGRRGRTRNGGTLRRRRGRRTGLLAAAGQTGRAEENPAANARNHVELSVGHYGMTLFSG